MNVQKIPIQPSYRKDNGIWVLCIDTSVLPLSFTSTREYIVSVPPGQVGGNHQHPRIEAFIATSPGLVMYWQDALGKRHEESMMDNENLYLFIVPSLVPHAIRNTSNTSLVFYEFAESEQHDVEAVTFI